MFEYRRVCGVIKNYRSINKYFRSNFRVTSTKDKLYNIFSDCLSTFTKGQKLTQLVYLKVSSEMC